jgi:hypothetical protein
VVLRTRREIVQHAEAASYIMTGVYLHEKHENSVMGVGWIDIAEKQE